MVLFVYEAAIGSQEPQPVSLGLGVYDMEEIVVAVVSPLGIVRLVDLAVSIPFFERGDWDVGPFRD